MLSCKTNALLLILLGCMLFISSVSTASDQRDLAETVPARAEVESVIRTLEDPEARATLI